MHSWQRNFSSIRHNHTKKKYTQNRLWIDVLFYRCNYLLRPAAQRISDALIGAASVAIAIWLLTLCGSRRTWVANENATGGAAASATTTAATVAAAACEQLMPPAHLAARSHCCIDSTGQRIYQLPHKIVNMIHIKVTHIQHATPEVALQCCLQTIRALTLLT